MSQLQLDITGDWSTNHDNTQWLGNFSDASGQRHYSFARLGQDTRSLGVRVSYTATPTLSLQIYSAPFVSSGTYSDVRELSPNPRASSYGDRYVRYAAPASVPLALTSCNSGPRVWGAGSSVRAPRSLRCGRTVATVSIHGFATGASGRRTAICSRSIRTTRSCSSWLIGSTDPDWAGMSSRVSTYVPSVFRAMTRIVTAVTKSRSAR